MKITKNVHPLEPGTIVYLPSDEYLRIIAFKEELSGVVYQVQFLELDGDEYVECGEPRYVSDYELVGGEF